MHTSLTLSVPTLKPFITNGKNVTSLIALPLPENYHLQHYYWTSLCTSNIYKTKQIKKKKRQLHVIGRMTHSRASSLLSANSTVHRRDAKYLKTLSNDDKGTDTEHNNLTPRYPEREGIEKFSHLLHIRTTVHCSHKKKKREVQYEDLHSTAKSGKFFIYKKLHQMVRLAGEMCGGSTG